jgi:glycosyltransferase 2 family protein
VKRLISIGVSLAILVVIYWKIDLAKLAAVFGQCDRLWLAISLGMVVPITLATAWRLQQLMPRSGPDPMTPARGLSFAEANRLILAASVLNMVLPSKMGDIAKAYFMRDRGQLDGSLALSLVVFEKACDMLSLLLWCTVGLLLFPRRDLLFGVMTIAIGLGLAFGLLMLGSIGFARAGFGLGRRVLPGKWAGKIDRMADSWEQMHGYFWSDRRRLLTVTVTSVFIWFLHLLQIWFFIVALRASVPLLTSLALSPLAILAGLLPLTFAGVGTRDAALIAFYGPYFPAATGAALGVLCTSRYVMPAIGGLPFLNRYLGLVKRG